MNLSEDSSIYFSVPPSHRGLLDRKIVLKTVAVHGLGHLGSWISIALASLGVKNMYLFDFDKVEERNLSGSVYNKSDLGLFKDEALIRHMRGISRESFCTFWSFASNRGNFYCRTEKGRKIVSRGFPMQPFCDFYVLSTDSAKSRLLIMRNIWKQWRMFKHSRFLKNINPVIIDARSGGAYVSMLSVPILDDELMRRYEAELIKLCGEPSDVTCDTSNIIQVPFFIASIAAQIVSSFTMGEEEHFHWQGSLQDLTTYPYKIRLEDYLPLVK